MKNPYSINNQTEHFLLSKRAAWVCIFVFLFLLFFPPLYRHVFEMVKPSSQEGEKRWIPLVEFFQKEKGKSLLAHFEDFESKVEEAPFREFFRKGMQSLQTRFFREGNRKVLLGKDGWLFYRPGIDALTGYGPLQLEPDTVAKDPTRPPWRGPLQEIEHFAHQLRELNVELILVPIPTKAMIYPEFFTKQRGEGPLTHRDQRKFFDQLQRSGVEVIDLTFPFFEQKQADQLGDYLFLKQDTHWSQRGMQVFAKMLADKLKTRSWWRELSGEKQRYSLVEEKEKHLGDLALKLDTVSFLQRFSPEEQNLVRVLDEITGSEVRSDTQAPIVLLGDSFVNIYDDESLGFGSGAGFAQHLRKELGIPLDVIARNGQGATGVRRELAQRRGSEKSMQQKKAVVWAIASRDLFLSETVARETNVEWESVEFNDLDPLPLRKGELILRGTIVGKEEYDDPEDTPYPEQLYEIKYRIDAVEKGEYQGREIFTFQWAFRNSQLEPAAHYQLGDVHRLTVVPFSSKRELEKVQRVESGSLEPYYFVEKVEVLGGKEKVSFLSTPYPHLMALLISMAIIGAGSVLVWLRQRNFSD